MWGAAQDTATSPLTVNPGASAVDPWSQAAGAAVGGCRVFALALGARGRRIPSLAGPVWSAGPKPLGGFAVTPFARRLIPAGLWHSRPLKNP